MRSVLIVRIGLCILVLVILLSAFPAAAAAQVTEGTGLPLFSSRTEKSFMAYRETDEIVPDRSEVAALLLGLLALGILGAGVEAVDRARDLRREQAALLQARIVDALLRDPRLTVLAVTATVQLPLWRRSPARIEIWGQVPTVELWQAVLRLAGEVTSRLWAVYRVHDRIAIVPSIEAYAT